MSAVKEQGVRLKSSKHILYAGSFISTLLPSFTLAADVGGGSGLVSGFLHPLLGFDHLLAMLAVGLLSVQIGGRAVWSVPLAFLAFLAIGGGLGLMGMPLPQVEGAIALSVFGLGLAIALNATIR